MNKSKFVYYIIATLCLLSVACTERHASLERALRYAGDNRAELEKVLAHYASDPADSLKLRAAQYLIENMPYHRSYPADVYHDYCTKMDSLFRNSEKGDTLVAAKASAISAEFEPRLKPVFDILEITSDYLIWNIDYSFEQWETSRFLQHLEFDDFCEYVLPYKCLEMQPIDDWKERWSKTWRGELDWQVEIDELKYNVRRATEAITYFYKNSDSLRMEVRQISGMDHIDILNIETLAIQPYGTCLERSRLGLFNCRSKSLPVSFDFTPCWADRGGPHYWNNVYVSRRRSPDYEPFNKYPGAYHYPDNAMAKVYRMSYAPHPLLMEVVERGGNIPPSLSALFIRDVTAEYGRTTDITIPLLSDVDSQDGYAYLAVFDNSDWVPMDICRIKRRKASFNDVGLDILYMVVAYEDKKIKPLSHPFIVDVRKRVNYIKADTSRMQDVRLRRKFPAFSHIYGNVKYLHGGTIEAANDKYFVKPHVVAQFPANKFLAGEVCVTDTLPYRYWRLRSTGPQASDFAEIYFYDRDSIVGGELYYPATVVRNERYDTPQHICDNDPLTYMTVDSTDCFRWAGFDFGKPVSLNKIAYIRRGDGNDICPGDEYEFYYWLNGEWHLHDKQTAENVYLDFKNVPCNGLYFIKGLSRGVQNRTFIYENGEVHWY